MSKPLILEVVSISYAESENLAQILRYNTTLERLYLSNNNISDGGAVALAQALRHNSNLERLHLTGNNAIGKEGTCQLVQALTVNLRITLLDGGGLTLPRKCKKYATECTRYDRVEGRIGFLPCSV